VDLEEIISDNLDFYSTVIGLAKQHAIEHELSVTDTAEEELVHLMVGCTLNKQQRAILNMLVVPYS